MKQITSNKLLWCLITIEDPNFLPGKSIQEVVKLFLDKIEFKFATFDYIDGALTGELEEKESTILTVTDLMEKLLHVEQFVWGNFFLFKESPETWVAQKYIDYPLVIAQTDTTIRAVDGQYIYIYTPYQELVDLLKTNYVIESITEGPLNTLQYPE